MLTIGGAIRIPRMAIAMMIVAGALAKPAA